MIATKFWLALAVWLSMMVLAGCGGGGGGNTSSNPPSPSPITTAVNVFPNDDFLVIAVGSASGDINAATGIDLMYTRPLKVLGADIANLAGKSLRIATPPAAVRSLWTTPTDRVGAAEPCSVENSGLGVTCYENLGAVSGITGAGVNVVIWDLFTIDDAQTHGYNVMNSARSIAPQANYLSLQRGSSSQSIEVLPLYEAKTNSLLPADTEIGVINASFEHRLNCGTSCGVLPVLDADGNWLGGDAKVRAWFTGFGYRVVTGQDTSVMNSADAVIVKAAGNVGEDANNWPFNFALVHAADTGPRTLVVGGLDRYVTAGADSSAAIASSSTPDINYDSNYAGANEVMQNRFVVEYGGSPYAEPAYLCGSPPCDLNNPAIDLDEGDGIQGTSFAAPRVAGYAALYRQKFPNQSGAATAARLLDTAGYDGLACSLTSAGCDVEIYGQGHIKIGTALSPAGPLQ